MWTPHRHTECVSESHLAPDCEFYFSSLKRSILSVCVFFCVCVSVNHCLFWLKTFFLRLLVLSSSFSPPPWWLSLFPVIIVSLRLILENIISQDFFQDFWTVFLNAELPKQIFTLMLAHLPALVCPRSNTWHSSALRCFSFCLGVSKDVIDSVTMCLCQPCSFFERAVDSKAVWLWVGERSLCAAVWVSWATFRFVYLVLAFYPLLSVSFRLCFSFFFLNVTSLLAALAGMCCNPASPSLFSASPPHCLAETAWGKLISLLLAVHLFVSGYYSLNFLT